MAGEKGRRVDTKPETSSPWASAISLYDASFARARGDRRLKEHPPSAEDRVVFNEQLNTLYSAVGQMWGSLFVRGIKEGTLYDGVTETIKTVDALKNLLQQYAPIAEIPATETLAAKRD